MEKKNGEWINKNRAECKNENTLFKFRVKSNKN